MTLILPKGIVVNSPEIEGSIERINAEPLDLADIAKFWKVYTTTKRRLLDPTAERLENYWWRIWGSRSRELKGATVARLFAYISDGQSFVPLRGPPNRDEGTPPLERRARYGPGASSTTAIHRPNQSRPSTTSSSTASRGPAVMPHPILKKTRGPSTTGPRPTARFISPHESADEGAPISPVDTNSHVIVQPPSPVSQDAKTDEKASSGHSSKKKGGFVAHTAAKKKRPIVMRRQSSQTSQTSQSSTDSPAKADTAQSAAPLQSSSDRTPPTFPEPSRGKGKQRAQAKSQENFSPSPERSRTQSPRTRSGKSSQKSTSGSRRASDEVSEKRLQEPASTDDPGPYISKLRPVENNRNSPPELTEEELEELEVQKLLLEEANARVQKKYPASSQDVPSQQNEGVQTSRTAFRSRSDGQHNPAALAVLRGLPKETKSGASAAPTLTDATGQLDLGKAAAAVPKNTFGSTNKLDKGKGRDPEDIQPAGMFAKRPVQSVATASVPDSISSLARSKSQLTLLLERDRANSNEKKSKDEKGSDKKN